MTEPIIETEAPSLIGEGTKALQDRAKHLGLSWTMRRATIVKINNQDVAQVLAQYDGDDKEIGMYNATGRQLYMGQRVYGLFVPPSANYVIGFVQQDIEIARTRRTSNKMGITTESPLLRIDNILTTEGSLYRVEGRVSVTNVTTQIVARLRYSTAGVATTGSTALEESVGNSVNSGLNSAGGTLYVIGYYTAGSAPLSVLLSLQAGVAVEVFGTNDEHCELVVTKVGVDPGLTGVEL